MISLSIYSIAVFCFFFAESVYQFVSLVLVCFCVCVCRDDVGVSFLIVCFFENEANSPLSFDGGSAESTVFRFSLFTDWHLPTLSGLASYSVTLLLRHFNNFYRYILNIRYTFRVTTIFERIHEFASKGTRTLFHLRQFNIILNYEFMLYYLQGWDLKSKAVY